MDVIGWKARASLFFVLFAVLLSVAVIAETTPAPSSENPTEKVATTLTPALALYADQTQSLPLDSIQRVRAKISEHAQLTGQIIQIRVNRAPATENLSVPAEVETREIHFYVFTQKPRVEVRVAYDLDSSFPPEKQDQVQKILLEATSENHPEALALAIEKSIQMLLDWLASPSGTLLVTGESASPQLTGEPAESEGSWVWGFLILIFGLIGVGISFAILTRVEIHFSAHGRERLSTLKNVWLDLRDNLRRDVTEGGTDGSW